MTPAQLSSLINQETQNDATLEELWLARTQKQGEPGDDGQNDPTAEHDGQKNTIPVRKGNERVQLLQNWVWQQVSWVETFLLMSGCDELCGVTAVRRQTGP